MPGCVTAAAVWTGARLEFTDAFAYLAGVRALRLGIGEEVTVRIERPEDAYTHEQLRIYYGRVINPVVVFTGYHKHEWHAMLKAQFMPEGKTSLTQLNRWELDDYIRAAEQYAREEIPEAFEKRADPAHA